VAGVCATGAETSGSAGVSQSWHRRDYLRI
jgi:hypothetical protein